MTNPVVRFSRVRKSFGAVRVLRGVDLELVPGSFLGLAGINGAGKTTLIKCLLDFCDIDAGAIEIHGIDFRRPGARARLAFLPERFMPPYFLTGREFVRSMMELGGSSYDEAGTRAMFESLDLDCEALGQPVRSYSKGMTQKLGLAACFLWGRDLYVLDEPMSGLDPKARARVKEILRRLKNEGRTLLFTTHSLADIEEICDYMAVLHQGRLAYAGTPAEFGQSYGEKSLERAFLKCIEAATHG